MSKLSLIAGVILIPFILLGACAPVTEPTPVPQPEPMPAPTEPAPPQPPPAPSLPKPLEPPPPVTVEISSDRWEQTSGPQGASVCRLTVDSTTPNIVYAGLEEGGIYRSTDGGETWSPVLVRSDSYIRSITNTPQSVWAASHSIGLQRSDDHGLTWQEVSVGPEERVNNVVYSPHGDLLLASTQSWKVYVSHDNGQSWRDVTGDLPREEISTLGQREQMSTG